MHGFTGLFLLALGAGLLLELWLLRRQQSCVALHREQVPAAFADQVAPAEHRKAADYTQAKIRLSRLHLLFGAVLLLALTLGGVIDALDHFWRSQDFSPLASGIALVGGVFLLVSLLELPFSAWRTFVLETRFGFNRTTPRRFLLDLLLQMLVLSALGLPLLAAILWLMQEAGAGWWLYAWLLWIGFTLLVTWLYPTLIAPLFNRFTPLQGGELKQRIQRLLKRCGFATKGIFVMDGSRRSGHGNAYFTGFGRNKRIVFFDTLVASLDHDEMEAVLAHELGHYKHRHVLKQLALGMIATLLGLALLGWLAGQHWFYQALGVTLPSNAAALLLFLLVSPVFTQFLQPLHALISRRHEFEADNFAREQSGPEPLIRALVKLYRDNASTLTPDPLYSAFHDSHPPAPLRVARLSCKTGTEPRSTLAQ
mgnify:FL=1|jgi:STE24 endopeptidase